MRKIVIAAAWLAWVAPALAGETIPAGARAVIDAGLQAWWQCLTFEMTAHPPVADEMDEDRWARAGSAIEACQSIPDRMVRSLNEIAPPGTIDPALFWATFAAAERERMRGALYLPPAEGGR